MRRGGARAKRKMRARISESQRGRDGAIRILTLNSNRHSTAIVNVFKCIKRLIESDGRAVQDVAGGGNKCRV